MTKLFYLFFLFQFYAISGQFQITTDRRYPPSPYSAEMKDIAEFVVLYNITFIDEKDKKNDAQAILQIGNHFSKFIGITNLKRDSLMQEHSKEESIGAKEINELGRLKLIYKKNILKDWVSHSIFFQERISTTVYQYQESFPTQNWMLTNDKRTILGYHCKSAKLNFRGRNYLAWYTEEIPKNDGPANFSGLPGLILKITSDDGIYDFSAIAIEKKKMKIYWRNEKKILQISRTDFRKIQRNYFENPGLFLHGKAYDSNGNEIVPKFNSKPYNPLELE